MTKIITNTRRTMFLVVMTILMAIAYHGEALQCKQVNNYLEDCVTYLKTGGVPSTLCCAGLKRLKAAVPGKPDIQLACTCLKSVATETPEINDDNAKQLPSQCGVDFGVPFSKTVNCDSIN